MSNKKYYKLLNTNIIQSEEFSEQNANSSKLRKCSVEARSPKQQEYLYFLNMFYMLRKKPTRKAYILSESERKFQKVPVKVTVLKKDLLPHMYFKRFYKIIIEQYFNLNSNPYLKEINAKFLTLNVANSETILNLNNVESKAYNTSDTFKSLFSSRARGLNLRINMRFQTDNINQMFLHLKLFNYFKNTKTQID